MKQSIKANLENAAELEELYQSDKKLFEQSFREISSEITPKYLVEYWMARFDFGQSPISAKQFPLSQLIGVVIICCLAGILINLPGIIGFDQMKAMFFEKNALLIVFAMLVLYETWIQKILQPSKIILITAAFLLPTLFINLLPADQSSQTVTLSCLHLPLVLWCMYGFVQTGFATHEDRKRFSFIKLNGNMVILGTLILIAGAALSGITIGLFATLNLHIEKFFANHIATWGLAAAPVVTAFLTLKYPTLTQKIAPIIANIFCPLISIVLLSYLVYLPFSGADIFNNRDYLLIFNIILLGVIAIITFSISETSTAATNRINHLALFILSCITVIVNAVAITGIVYRLMSFGITPNRLAVIGSNILIFIHLLAITYKLFEINFRKAEMQRIEITIARFLPVYFVWVSFVTFLFPFIFRMK